MHLTNILQVQKNKNTSDGFIMFETMDL